MPGKRLRAAVCALATRLVLAAAFLLLGSSFVMWAAVAPATAGPAPAPPAAFVRQASLTSPSPSPSLLPAGPPPGERNPIEGAAAVIAIVIVAAAGVFIYGVIRKGL